MAITITKFESLKKKFKNLEFKAIETNETGGVEVFSMTWQNFGLPGKASPGLIEVNAMWDESKSRPKGYYIAHGFEKEEGLCVSVMVTEEWLDNNKASTKREEWEKTS